jgi:hypothetical protein
MTIERSCLVLLTAVVGACSGAGTQSQSTAPNVPVRYDRDQIVATSTPACSPVSFRILSLWRVSADGTWVRRPGPTAGRAVELKCNTATRLADVLDEAVPAGTYWVIAQVNGARHADYMYVGATMCNDVDIGPEKPSQVALCVLIDEKQARAQYVADPRALE